MLRWQLFKQCNGIIGQDAPFVIKMGIDTGIGKVRKGLDGLFFGTANGVPLIKGLFGIRGTVTGISYQTAQ